MFRIGQGIDVHKLVSKRELILGGVKIPHTKGLLGHSDADVLTHSIIDAILGATALGDIGSWFPDNDEQYKNANSLKLLEKVITNCEIRKFNIVNLDATIIAQEPKISSFILKIREKLAAVLSININSISIKATTTEKLGFIGNKEGIAATTIILLTDEK